MLSILLSCFRNTTWDILHQMRILCIYSVYCLSPLFPQNISSMKLTVYLFCYPGSRTVPDTWWMFKNYLLTEGLNNPNDPLHSSFLSYSDTPLHCHSDVIAHSIEIWLTRLALIFSLAQHLFMNLVQSSTSLGPFLISKLTVHYTLTVFLIPLRPHPPSCQISAPRFPKTLILTSITHVLQFPKSALLNLSYFPEWPITKGENMTVWTLLQ